MGYIRHNAVLVTYWDDKHPKLQAAIDNLPDEARRCIHTHKHPSNFLYTTLYLPDGSKEGWKTSDDHDEWRQAFIDAANQLDMEVLELRFGGDDDAVEAAYSNHGDNRVSGTLRSSALL